MKAFGVLVYLVGVLRSSKLVGESSAPRYMGLGGTSSECFSEALSTFFARIDLHFGNSNTRERTRRPSSLFSPAISGPVLSRNHSLFKAPAALFSFSLFWQVLFSRVCLIFPV